MRFLRNPLGRAVLFLSGYSKITAVIRTPFLLAADGLQSALKCRLRKARRSGQQYILTAKRYGLCVSQTFLLRTVRSER